MTTKNKVTGEMLSPLSGWQIAELLGISYNGDGSVIQHEGYFYSTRDWNAFGYADCVEFWRDPEEENILHVHRATIHKLEGDKLRSAFRCIGVANDDYDTLNNIHAQIDVCKAYAGAEPDYYDSGLSFDTDTDSEDEIWQQALSLLRCLTD